MSAPQAVSARRFAPAGCRHERDADQSGVATRTTGYPALTRMPGWRPDKPPVSQFSSSVHLLLAGRLRALANSRALERIAEGSKQPQMADRSLSARGRFHPRPAIRFALDDDRLPLRAGEQPKRKPKPGRRRGDEAVTRCEDANGLAASCASSTGATPVKPLAEVLLMRRETRAPLPRGAGRRRGGLGSLPDGESGFPPARRGKGRGVARGIDQLRIVIAEMDALHCGADSCACLPKRSPGRA